MLNETIQTLRKARGLSQEELARRLHVVRQTVSKWEKGLSVPDAEMLIRLAEALDTAPAVLLGETPEAAPADSVAELAVKLESLNQQFAREAEGRRKRRRAGFALLGAVSLLGLLRGALGAIHLFRANQALANTRSIIGGADGPTAILVSGPFLQAIPLLLAAAAAIAAAIGLYRTRRK